MKIENAPHKSFSPPLASGIYNIPVISGIGIGLQIQEVPLAGIDDSPQTITAAVSYWTETIGAPIFDYDSKNKKTSHTGWSTEDDTNIDYKANLAKGFYNNGIAVRTGRLNRGPYVGGYLDCIDFDTWEAFLIWCGEDHTLDTVAKWTRVEWHQNPARIHVFFITKTPLKDLSRNKNNKIIEVYSEKPHLVCVYGNHADGNPIGPYDSKKIVVLDNIGKLEIESRIKLVIPSYLDSFDSYVKELEDPNTIVPRGSVHIAVRTMFMSVYFRWQGEFADLSDEQRFQYVVDWDKKKAEQANRPAYIDANPKKLKQLWEGIKQKYYSQRERERNKRKENNNSNYESGILESEESNIIEDSYNLIMGRYNLQTVRENKEILYYHNGIYVPGGESLIEGLVERTYNFQISNHSMAEIRGHVIRSTYCSRQDFDADIYTINLQNGLYNIKTGEFKEHTPRYISISQIPIMYDPKAKPKLFGKFLSQVLYPSEIRTAIELMAYTFFHNNPFELITILFGYGANGKSVFTRLLTALHGFKNISNVPLDALLEDRFALSDLEGKSVNIDSELTSTTIKNTSVLKKITGRQPMRIQRKNERAYDTVLYAKLFFSANKIPMALDESDAFFRRKIILSFPNKFEGKKDDPDLLNKITTPEELSGIFNVLMIVLRNVLARNCIYTKEKTIEERREKYTIAANPMEAFFAEVIAEDSVVNDVVTKDRFYQAYIRFCNLHKLAVLSKESLGKILVSRQYQSGRQTSGKRETVWKGIKLKPEYEIDLKQESLDALR